MPRTPPLILLPGLDFDGRLFRAQIAEIPGVLVQEWPELRSGETLRSFARRVADLVAPVVRADRRCVIGGASFGAIVAREVAPLIGARACVVIGGVSSPDGLPHTWRMAGLGTAMWPDARRDFPRWGAGLCRIAGRTQHVRWLRRIAGEEGRFTRWAFCATASWRPGPSVLRVPSFHIHGSADEVFPVDLARPDVVVEDGPHALTLARPAEVNAFLRGVLRRVAG